MTMGEAPMSPPVVPELTNEDLNRPAWKDRTGPVAAGAAEAAAEAATAAAAAASASGGGAGGGGGSGGAGPPPPPEAAGMAVEAATAPGSCS